MSSSGNIDYRSGIDLVGSCISDMEIESNGIHLLTKLLNDVNHRIISNIEKEYIYNSAGQISENALVYYGIKGFGRVFGITLRKKAMAEALRQLTFLEKECYTEDSFRNIQLRLTIEKEIRDEELREDEKLTNHFISRVENLCNKILGDFLIDSDGKSLLSHRLHDFMRIVAKTADDMFFEKDELQPEDIQNIVEKYLGKGTFKDAHRKGNTYLVLFKIGLLQFKPSLTFASCSNDGVAADKRNKMLTNRFISGIKNLHNQIVEDFWTDLDVKSFFGHQILEFMSKVAKTVSDTFSKKYVLQPEDIRNIVAKFFGKDTFNAANSKGNKYLLLFENGMLKIKLRPKLKYLSNDYFLEKKISVEDLEPSCKKVLNYKFPMSLSDKTVSIYLDQVLLDIAQYLAQNVAEMCQKKNTYEIRSEDIFQAVADIFPGQLKHYALLNISNDLKNFANGILIPGISENKYLAQNVPEMCENKNTYEIRSDDIFQAVDNSFPEQLKHCALLKGSSDVKNFANGVIISGISENQYLAQNVPEMCENKNTDEIRREDIFQAVANNFPEQLKQNALLKCSSDVKNFTKGIIISGISENQYLSQNVPEMCEKKNTYEIRSGTIFQAVADSFPKQLKQNALLKGSDDVKNFANGIIISGISENAEIIVSKRVLRNMYTVFNNVIGTVISTGLKTAADNIVALGSEVMESSLNILAEPELSYFKALYEHRKPKKKAQKHSKV